MAKYKYEGELPIFYPRYFADTEVEPVNLYALPGDVVDFPADENGDVRVPPGQWTLVEEPPKGVNKPKTTEKVTE